MNKTQPLPLKSLLLLQLRPYHVSEEDIETRPKLIFLNLWTLLEMKFRIREHGSRKS